MYLHRTFLFMPCWRQVQGSSEAHKAVLGLRSYPDENSERNSTPFLLLCTIPASLLQSPRCLSSPGGTVLVNGADTFRSGFSLSSKERQGASNPEQGVLLNPCRVLRWGSRCLPRYVPRCAEGSERLAMQPAHMNRVRASSQQGALWRRLGSSLAECSFPWAFVQDLTAVEWQSLVLNSHLFDTDGYGFLTVHGSVSSNAGWSFSLREPRRPRVLGQACLVTNGIEAGRKAPVGFPEFLCSSSWVSGINLGTLKRCMPLISWSHTGQKLMGQDSQVAVLEGSRLRVGAMECFKDSSSKYLALRIWHPPRQPSPSQEPGLNMTSPLWIGGVSPEPGWLVMLWCSHEEKQGTGGHHGSSARDSSQTLPKDPLLSALGPARGCPCYLWLLAWLFLFPSPPFLSPSPFLGSKLPHPQPKPLGPECWRGQRRFWSQISHSP